MSSVPIFFGEFVLLYLTQYKKLVVAVIIGHIILSSYSHVIIIGHIPYVSSYNHVFCVLYLIFFVSGNCESLDLCCVLQVNGSGQFVGVAEMIGHVDFSKNMDFWQLDKWNGFFPLKWHIIKDVPNTQLRHIILENNDNKAVTYSRDTQEVNISFSQISIHHYKLVFWLILFNSTCFLQVELKQGLEILSIFKNYSAKTCVLDDFNFYENREKALKAKRSGVPVSQTNGFRNNDYEVSFCDIHMLKLIDVDANVLLLTDI